MDLLREYFYELRDKAYKTQYEEDALETVVLDSVDDSEVDEAFFQIAERKIGMQEIIKGFIKKHLKTKTFHFKAVEDGELKEFNCKYHSRFPNEAYRIVTKLPYEEMAFLAKRLIVALANLEEIMDKGKVTPPLPADEGSNHEGERFIYSKKQVVYKGLEPFNALSEVKITKDRKSLGIYKLNIEGSASYNRRTHRIIIKLLKLGDMMTLRFYLTK